MDKAKLYLKYRKKEYLTRVILLTSFFVIAYLGFGAPKHYVVPALSMVTIFVVFEFVEYRSWKNNKN